METKHHSTNRFASVSDGTYHTCTEFAERNADVISLDQVLEKLIALDFVYPLLDDVFQGGRILEVGCGSGFQSALLTTRGEVAATELQHTVDWLGDTVDDTRQRVFDALAQRDVEFRFNDGLTLPFDDASFDMVFHNSVIEHVPDVVAFNREIHRVLKPGGICVCITGTPILVRLRFIRRYCLLFPAVVAHASLSVFLNSLLSRSTGLRRKLGARARSWHFIPAHQRAEDIRSRLYPGDDAPSTLTERQIRDMYPRLRHVLRDPHYNGIVIERLAAAHGVTPQGLLSQLALHFRSPWNAFCLRMTVPTHGQHTRNFRTEMQEWDIGRWIRTHEQADLRVETVRGYRYQQVFEVTLSKRLNSWMAYRALPAARALARRLPARLASEFILIARKEA